MPRLARGEYLNPREIQIVHACQRCVRRAFLCGTDEQTGKSFEHRREWIRQRLEFLASVFGIDCLTYTVMSNHIHLILRSRPDVVAAWSDDDVARRWLRLFPKQRKKNGDPVEPEEADINAITKNKERLTEVRGRLSDISWWMRCTAENIARRSNKEDECRGHFWEGRYKAQQILDEASLLACAAYVDLNPVRAAMATTPESSRFTGAKDRIDDLKERKSTAAATSSWERNQRRQHSGWMSPVEIHEASDPIGADVNSSGRRASDKGFLALPLPRYLELLDWTGRALRTGKRGRIPAHLKPILERLGIDSASWCEVVETFGRVFMRAAGTTSTLAAEADRRNQSRLHAPGARLLSATG